MYINCIKEISLKGKVNYRCKNTGKKNFPLIKKQRTARKKNIFINLNYFKRNYKFSDLTLKTIFQKPLDLTEQHEPSIETHYNIINFQNIIRHNNLDSSPNNLEVYYKDITNCKVSNYPNVNLKRRKFSKDSINKKIKRFFLIFLEEKFSDIMKMLPPKIPTIVIRDVSIEFNKNILNSSIKEFYEKYCSFEFTFTFNDSSKNEFLNTSLKDFYQCYIIEKIKADLQILGKKETIEYIIKVEENAQNFINYYMLVKPFKKSKISCSYKF